MEEADNLLSKLIKSGIDFDLIKKIKEEEDLPKPTKKVKKSTKVNKITKQSEVKESEKIDPVLIKLDRRSNKAKLEKLQEIDLRTVSPEEKDRINTKIESLKKKIEIAKLKTPEYNENQLRHKHYREVKEGREDLSSDVKDIIHKIQNQGEYKLATYQGRAGGNRKLLGCPHCNGVMLAAGIKLKRNFNSEKPQTQGQRMWQEYVKNVALIPDYKGIARPKILKAASELKGRGVTLDEIKALHMP